MIYHRDFHMQNFGDVEDIDDFMEEIFPKYLIPTYLQKDTESDGNMDGKTRKKKRREARRMRN
jgi:hypothetical protein